MNKTRLYGREQYRNLSEIFYNFKLVEYRKNIVK